MPICESALALTKYSFDYSILDIENVYREIEIESFFFKNNKIEEKNLKEQRKWKKMNEKFKNR